MKTGLLNVGDRFTEKADCYLDPRSQEERDGGVIWSTVWEDPGGSEVQTDSSQTSGEFSIHSCLARALKTGPHIIDIHVERCMMLCQPFLEMF